MTRMSKKSEIRNTCPKRLRPAFAAKTGSKEDALPEGYKKHENALQAKTKFIPKIK